MAGELLDIRHNDCFTLFPSRATYAASEADMHTSHRTLEWAQYQFVTLYPLEARPKEAHRLMDGSTDVGHHRNLIVLTLYQRANLRCK